MKVYKASIDSDELKKLSVLQPRSTMAAMALDWALIAAVIAISSHFGGVWLYLLAVAVIAGRMHALGVLMHEAAHFRFLKDRQRADVIADLFVAWPIMATVEGYRQNHLAHHQHTNTDRDPDWVVKFGKAAYTFPQELWVLSLNLLGYLVAVNSLRDLAHILPRLAQAEQTRRYRLARFAYYLLTATLMMLLGVWKGFLLYWIVPYLTMFPLFFYVRGVAEHFGSMDYDDELGSTRTVIPYFWERWFFAPHNINYHLEHHLFPGIPFYNLPKLSASLMRDETYRANAHITRGYSTGVLRECLAAVRRDKPGQLVQT
ncbi:fatty acid desaturase family protein [Bradyrhizobium sp.]|uniref:fatty acid desaturase family protein n=1 Tax=Bradyrhizobium sp. TaxID=376 RepID=UPI001D9D33E5|nr:fatty acid desaturase family protein [Bradyrhizobium sp.]MBV8700492.1 fatty acid desaturase family protein [Bradyrhizobium sp.]MBV9985887.1 fatty acid desaturase family protein [Bradyrhizobium sp.]